MRSSGCELDLDAGQELAVLRQAEMSRDPRTGAVGADEVAGGEVDAVDVQPAVAALGALEARVVEDRRAGFASPPWPSSAGGPPCAW